MIEAGENPRPRVRARALPRLVADVLHVTWAADRRACILTILLPLIGSASMAAALLLSRAGFGTFLRTDRPDEISAVLPTAVGLGILSAVMLYISALQRERQEILAEVVRKYIEGQLLATTCVVPLAAFDDPNFHNRVERVRTNDDKPLKTVYALSGLATGLLGTVGAIAAIVVIHPLILPVALVVLFPAWLVASRRGDAFYRFFWHDTPRDRERRYLATLMSDRQAAKEVRSFGTASYLRSRYDTLYEQRVMDLRRVGNRQLRYALITTLVLGAFVSFGLLLVAWLVSTDQIDPSDAGVALAGIALIGFRLTETGFAAGGLAEVSLYLDDVKHLVTSDSQVPPSDTSRPDPLEHVKVEGVSFTYPGGARPALNTVHLEIGRGEVVALVGVNGSGKTTLAKLIAHLYAPDEGWIAWNGRKYTNANVEVVRNEIAVLFQDFIHYHLSVRENIGFGRVQLMEDEASIMNAVKRARAEGIIEALPNGYDTLLGPEFDGGVDLSIGQWQRIALARSFLRDASLVILDEPTAALDARAERELFDHIRDLFIDRAVLLISHRFAAVRGADRIYVLDKGRIAETGTHETLMSQDGLYAELFNAQASAYRTETLP